MTDDLRRLAWAELVVRNPGDPWAWAMAHRLVNGRPMLHLPALAGIARDGYPLVVVQKAAQVGVTELGVNLALWAADTQYAGRGHVLYLMPTDTQMGDFAQGRFDRAVQDSPYLRARLQPEPPRRKGADSKRLKRIGDGYIYLRGSESHRQVASVDADLVVLDEYDQMGEGILELARRRIASSRRGRMFVASTPRYPEAGINELFLRSDQRHYLLPCHGCGTEQVLNFEDNVDRERLAMVCVECREPFDVRAEGRWVADAPGNETRGYHLSGLYSPWLNVQALVRASEETTPAAIQQFQNSDLGEVFSPPGGGLSLAELDRAREGYGLDDYAGERCRMGVDVGTRLHVVIREQPKTVYRQYRRHIVPSARRLWFAGEVGSFAELDGLIERFSVRATVVDGQPEGHAAREFADRHPRRVWLAQYRQSLGHEYVPGRPQRVLANRVEALDEVFEKFRSGEGALPREARRLGGRARQGVGEYYRELMASQRTLEQDAQGNWVSRYLKRDKADHYAHAEVYCLLAGRAPLLQPASAVSG